MIFKRRSRPRTAVLSFESLDEYGRALEVSSEVRVPAGRAMDVAVPDGTRFVAVRWEES